MKRRKFNFFWYFFPQVICVLLFEIGIIGSTLETLIFDEDLFLGLLGVLVSLGFGAGITLGLKERAVSCWNRVIVTEERIQAFSLLGKPLCSIDVNGPVYGTVLKLRDEWISRVDVLLVSEKEFELPSDSEVKLRLVYNRREQILIINPTRELFAQIKMIEINHTDKTYDL